MQISWLPDPESHPLWNDIYQLLKPAADFGGMGVRDDGELVWIAFEGPVLFGAATTFLQGEDAQIRCVAGTRFKEWGRQMEAVLSEWARDCGAARLTARGRKGWSRIYPSFGWVALGDNEYQKGL